MHISFGKSTPFPREGSAIRQRAATLVPSQTKKKNEEKIRHLGVKGHYFFRFVARLLKPKRGTSGPRKARKGGLRCFAARLIQRSRLAVDTTSGSLLSSRGTGRGEGAAEVQSSLAEITPESNGSVGRR